MKLSRRRILAACMLAILALIPAAKGGLHFHGSSGATGPGMLMNLSQPQYFSGYNSFLNWWKTGNAYSLVSSSHGTLNGQQIWDNGTYLDTTTGELKNPVPVDVTSISKGIFAPVINAAFQYEGTGFANFVGQQWDVTWSGCANPTPSVNNLGTGGTSSFGSNSGTFTFGTGANNVALTFSPNATGCTNNPPTNVKVFQHQYATNVANGEVTNPDWRADMSKFVILRLMDYMATNPSGITDSSQLASLSYQSYNGVLGLAWGSTASSISGSVLTASGEQGQQWQVGMRLVCNTCTNTMTIASLGTGTGGDGTYNLTCTPSCNTASGINIQGIPSVGTNQGNGPKGAIGPDIACAIANETGTGIEYPIPTTASNQYVTDIATALKACTSQLVKFSYGNENWNFSFATFAYVGALAVNLGLPSGLQYSGYRSAQIFNIIRGIYGSNSGAGRWIGALGTFNGIPVGSTTDVITGAATAITNLSLPPITQLVSQVDTAPYTGDFYGADLISNITASATPTVTAANDNGAGSPKLVNGQLIKLFVVGGTMAAALNNQYATVSSATTTSFVINISTVGLTYGGGISNIATDATLFKMADQSAALNISTPATYPTKFSFFTQQMSKAILTGSASDASYGTLTVGGNLSNAAGALPDLLSQIALIANASGLQMRQYEGGNSVSMGGDLQNNPPTQLLEYFINWQFDAGVTGDATNTEGGIETTLFNTTCSFGSGYSSYPAQYNDAGAQSQFGPWGALRFFPSDESNNKYATIAAYKGPCIDPSPAATWTASLPATATNRFFGTPGCDPCTDTLAGAVIGTAATSVKVLASLTGGTITSATCDGVTVTIADAKSTSGGRAAAIYTIPVGAGSNTRSCSVVFTGANSQFQEFYVLTVSGLVGSSPVSTAINGSGAASLAYHKNDLVLGVAACAGAFTNTTGVSPPGGTASTTTVFSYIDSVNGTFELAGFNWPFSAAKFNVAAGCTADLAVATYH